MNGHYRISSKDEGFLSPKFNQAKGILLYKRKLSILCQKYFVVLQEPYIKYF